MKQYIIILFISCLFFLTNISCKKALDITPNGRITMEEVFSNAKRAEAYLNTAYSHIPEYARSYGTTWTLLAGITDDAQDASSGNTVDFCFVTPWISGALTPSYDPLADRGNGNGMDRYATFWAGIRDVNVFLENIESVPYTDERRKRRQIGEATLLRAFYYWELIRKYGAMPIFDKPIRVDADFTQIKRPTFQENIDFIINDCNEAIANPDLPIRITTPSEGAYVANASRFSKALAYMIKSEASLYNASPLWNPNNDQSKWATAAQYSKEALDALTANGEYKLYDNYSEYFLTAQDYTSSPRDRETIFEIYAGNPGSVSNIPSKTGTWQLGACPSQEIVDQYEMQATGEVPVLGYNDVDHLSPIYNPSSGYDPQNPYLGRDPRFYANIWYNGALYDNVEGNLHTIETFVGGADEIRTNPPYTVNTHTGYYMRKGIDPKLTINQSKNPSWKKYRLAEIYLNLAEAENELNGPNSVVVDAINAVRARVNMPLINSGLTKEGMREKIRRERRVEMPYEEQRFWDVRRWKIIDQTDKLVTGMKITKNADNSFNYERFVVERRNAWQDRFLIFPIPVKDVTIIPNFEQFQNPDW